MGSLLNLIMWHGFFKTPVTFPKTQKWNSSGGSSAVGMTYFDSLFWPTYFVFVGQRYLSLCQGPIFSVVKYSVEQPSIRVRPSELRQLLCLSPVGRLWDIWKFLECRPTDTDWILGSTGLSGEFDKSTDGP